MEAVYRHLLIEHAWSEDHAAVRRASSVAIELTCPVVCVAFLARCLFSSERHEMPSSDEVFGEDVSSLTARSCAVRGRCGA